MKKLVTVYLSIVLFVLLMPLEVFAASPQVVEQIRQHVRTEYYGKVPANLNQLKDPHAITNALDKYSIYMTKKEFEEYVRLLSASAEEIIEEEWTGELASAILEKNPVTSKLLPGDIAYIQLTSFVQNSSDLVYQHWRSLRSNGAKALIIDLRNNGGGYVDSAQQIISFFPQAKYAYRQTTRHGEQLLTPYPTTVKFPKDTYILINKNSASASEMVAVSAKDQQLATLVGQKTYGKGTIQSFFRLSNGGVLKLTTGEFRGTAGTPVHQVGIQPDVPTRVNEELVTAHQALLTKQTMPMANSIKVEGRTVRMNLPYPMNLSEPAASHTVQLVQLGVGAVPIQVDQASPTEVTLTFKELLSTNEKYMVYFEPTAKRVHGKRNNTGFSAPVVPTKIN